eukprot:TRINITY_DN5038_c0_g1_i1.p1 TRINITY_DN5038_c0_g1~~TRINITY_DN5038_c0_g1_i1.p1  ORF type:complete len:246 (+),score=49.28 TRINITY_DN5038_c0_g1_i1:338-1075(+)
MIKMARLGFCIVAVVVAVAVAVAVVTAEASTTSSPADVNAAASPEYIAMFLLPSERQRLQAAFYNSTSGTGARQVQCDHMTLQFDPPAQNNWTKLYGEPHVVQVMVYGNDFSHGQAVMVRVVKGAARSFNSYPHMTVSVLGKNPYSAVYSNFLWERFVAADVLNVTRGDDGAPDSVSFVDDPSAQAWTGVLPDYQSGGQEYYETEANTYLVSSSGSGNYYKGIVCSSRIWNHSTGVCETDKLSQQ